MIEANETLQLQTIRPGDVRIDVEMGDITTADFERVPDTIPLGEAAARAKAAELAAVRGTRGANTPRGAPSVTQSQEFEARLAGVRYEGLEARQPGIPREPRESLKAGDTVDATKISAEAQRMSVLQDFDSVGYRLDGDPEAPDPHLAAAREELGS